MHNKKDILLKYKFDLSLQGAAEDVDLYARLFKDGEKFGVSNVLTYHYHRSYLEDFIRQIIVMVKEMLGLSLFLL